MTAIAEAVEHGAESALAEEYENVPVPLTARRSLASVSAVWIGFPMILTCAVFGGLVVYSLGFWKGMLAILVGNLVLKSYVGSLSYLAGKTGKNFALTAIETFGKKGYIIPSGFLATIVIGWFAFQTGLTGAILADTMHWSEAWTTFGAGVGYILITLLGIRALSVIGVIAAPLFIALSVTAVVLALRNSSFSEALSYSGGAGTAAMSMGAAITLVVACFIDSGTMTSDFTRWSRNGRQGFWAAFSAFPIANGIALFVGGLIVALGAATNPASNGGNFLGTLIDHGGLLVPLAVVFVFVNLGSVCAHCLYNGAVGWGQLSGNKMRPLTLILGVIGVALAVAGIWSHFEQWLNLLGVIVPPIGIVIILDQLVLPKLVAWSSPDAAIKWPPFAAWAVGSAAALAAHENAPWLSDALVGMVVGAIAFVGFRYIVRSKAVAA
jgi:cytosine permease